MRPLGDVEKCHRLGAVDRAMGRKCRCRRSAGDMVCIGPSDGSVVILATRHIVKMIAITLLRRAADSPPQDGHCMCSGAEHVGRKDSG